MDHFMMDMMSEISKGRGKNKLVEFTPGFAIDLVDLIEQNRRHSSVMLRILRLRIN